MTNFDEKTGIRYGVISPHSISPYALDDIYQRGTDPHYENAISELKAYAGEIAMNSPVPISDDAQERIADILIEEFNNGTCENSDGQMDYSDKEYDLHVSGDNFGIFVMRSPYYTYCRGCSPCAPGAGSLDNPYTEWPDMDAWDKTLCLGPEWFDTEDDQYAHKIRYRVFRVDNDQEVI